MDGNATITRRQFIVTAAGGLAIGLATGPSAFAATAGAQPWSSEDGHNPHDLDAFIAIEPDDSVLIRYVRSEMGQGSMTALPMIVTEELQCGWSKVRVEYASANRSVREDKVYGDMSSYGSHSVKLSREKMQQVGASARERLIAAATASLPATRRRSRLPKSRRSRRPTNICSSVSLRRASTYRPKPTGRPNSR